MTPLSSAVLLVEDGRTWCKGSHCCSKLIYVHFMLPLGLISFIALGPEAMEDVVLAFREKPTIGLGKKACMCETTANWLGMETNLC